MNGIGGRRKEILAHSAVQQNAKTQRKRRGRVFSANPAMVRQAHHGSVRRLDKLTAGKLTVGRLRTGGREWTWMDAKKRRGVCAFCRAAECRGAKGAGEGAEG